MPITTSNKTVKFSNITLYITYFKNVEATQLEELFDLIYHEFYQAQASILTTCFVGDKNFERLNKKAEKKVFGERNWPIIRIINEENNKYSGFAIAIAGVNVKTVSASNFLLKMLDFNQSRFCYIGDIDTTTDTDTVLSTALLMAGLSQNNIIDNWLTSSFENSCKPVAENKGINAIAALNPMPELVNENPIHVKGKQLGCLKLSNIAKFIANGNSYSSQITAVLDFVEAELAKAEMNWKDLIIGFTVFADLKEMKIFKTICKERKIPAAPFMPIKREFINTNTGFDLEVIFVKGYEREA